MKDFKVYKHTFPNGKVYIGITSYKYVTTRWGHDGKEYSSQPYIMNAINKYGWNNIKHEVLFKGLTKEEAETKEIELIAFYDSTNKKYGYNISKGGYNCNPISEEGKKKLRNRMKINNPMFNKEIALKISRINKGNKLSESTKKLISKNSTVIHPIICLNTNEKFDRIIAAANKYHIDRSSITNVCKGLRYSVKGLRFAFIDNVDKIKQRKNKAVLKVKCIEDNLIFNSISDASIKYAGKQTSNISNCLNGRAKTAYGKHWEYL